MQKGKGHTWLAARVLMLIALLCLIGACTGYVMFGEGINDLPEQFKWNFSSKP
jgi:hypothetical protein